MGEWTQDSLLTVTELAEYLKLSVSAIHRLTHKRKLPFYQPGGKVILFRKGQIDTWLEDHKIHNEKEKTLKTPL